MTARRSDPASSHEKVAAIRTDVTLEQMIAAVFLAHRGKALTDGDICYEVNLRSPFDYQRNVVARKRIDMERKGFLERRPVADSKLLHFVATKKLPSVRMMPVLRRSKTVTPLVLRVDGDEIRAFTTAGEPLASRERWTLQEIQRYAEALASNHRR